MMGRLGADLGLRDQYNNLPIHLAAVENVPDILGYILAKDNRSNHALCLVGSYSLPTHSGRRGYVQAIGLLGVAVPPVCQAIRRA
jgi:hypothetical protein